MRAADKPVELRRYVVPGHDGDQGGTFVLGSDGFFACVTDWGNYVYFWNNYGDRDFLTGLGGDYLTGKLGQGRKRDQDLMTGFAKQLWPRFRQVLKDELAKEAQ